MAKTLTVYLAADVSRLNRGLDQGRSALGSFESTIGKLGLALGSVFAAQNVIDFFKDSAAAALEDDKAVRSLNQTLENVGFGAAAASVQDFVDRLQRATGVSDGELRPALDRLLRSTSSIEEAEKALSLALDVSAGSGKSLQAVADSLGKAYDGNTAGLGRLGIGLDKATLATGDMNKITAAIAKTFDNQASVAAESFQGKINRVTVAVDEAKEAIGYALLNAIDDVSNSLGGTTGLTTLIDDFGKRTAGAVTGLGYLVDTVASLKWVVDKARMAIEDMTPALRFVIDGIIRTLNPLGVLIDGLNDVRTAYDQANGAAEDSAKSSGMSANALSTLRLQAQQTAIEQQKLAAEEDKASNARKTGTSGVDAMTEALNAQKGVIGDLISKLQQQTTELDAANVKVKEYAENIAGSILKDVNLGQAAETGKQTGQSLLEAFNAQVNQAKYFGNVLTAIKAQGADQSLIEQIASLGPLAGSALGQQLLDEGLVPQINASWVDVQKTVSDLALGLVPDFLLAGQESAISLVNGTVEQLGKEEKRLRQIGKNIGKPIGANIKAEIAAAVAEAVSAAEAAKSAAAAERASQIAAQQVVVTEQQVAQALNRLIVNSNARTGYQTAPATSPVFG
jgi:hypothetical protein